MPTARGFQPPIFVSGVGPDASRSSKQGTGRERNDLAILVGFCSGVSFVPFFACSSKRESSKHDIGRDRIERAFNVFFGGHVVLVSSTVGMERVRTEFICLATADVIPLTVGMDGISAKEGVHVRAD